MPLYEFECVECKHRAEKIRRMDDNEPIECSKCGGKAVKVTSRTAPPKFNGPGFTPKFHR